MGVMQVKPAMSVDNPLLRDLLLAEAVARGSVEARRALANRLFDRVRATMSYIADSADAEDLAQTALIQILRVADTYRGESAIEVWADRVSVRCALKYFEKTRRRKALTEASWVPANTIDSTEEQVARRRTRQRLSALLQELPTDQSLTLVLHYLHGYKIEEIAVIMGTLVNTVRGRLRTARKKMKQKILSDPALGDWIQGRLF